MFGHNAYPAFAGGTLHGRLACPIAELDLVSFRPTRTVIRLRPAHRGAFRLWTCGCLPFVLPIALALTGCSSPHSSQDAGHIVGSDAEHSGEDNENEKRWEVRITFSSMPGTKVEYVIDRAELIKQLVLTPMSEAKEDVDPAKYIIIGTMSVMRPSGKQSSYTLFSNFGRYKSDGKYFVADFTKLKERIRLDMEMISIAF